MRTDRPQPDRKASRAQVLRRVYRYLAPRAPSVIMFGALFCTVAVKFFKAYSDSRLDEYFWWIVPDFSVLVLAELVLALVCFRWSGKWVFRVMTMIAAVACTWSIIHAAYLIRTGTEALPRILLTVVRDPVNGFRLIGGNLVKLPVSSTILLAPSAVAFCFLLSVLAKPGQRGYDRRRFSIRVGVCLLIGLSATFTRVLAGPAASSHGRNPQARAVMSFFYPRVEESKRRLPYFDQVRLHREDAHANHNIVIVVLEGIQYAYTSLAGDKGASTPFLVELAGQGVEFSNMRATMTHTTKALFSLLTGRYPSASDDLAEAIPSAKPYASLVTILERQLGFRTAFFQSAKGDFESRPGLIHNLGYDKFWARDDLGDPNHYIYYLACDEFTMLDPITDWIKSDSDPFLLTILCSVTHDPYDVPEWYGERAKEPEDRYRQTIEYTDGFLAALDEKLADLGLTDSTILCVVGDHGEAFGEHGRSGHDKIAFDEALRVPLCIRAPSFVDPGRKITQAVSSIDLTPTLLGLLGFRMGGAGFDGVDALRAIPADRRVYFSAWSWPPRGGFVQNNRKFIYYAEDESTSLYDLWADPGELHRIELPEAEAQKVAEDVSNWGKGTIFRLSQPQRAKETVFDRWLVSWSSRLIVRAKYLESEED